MESKCELSRAIVQAAYSTLKSTDKHSTVVDLKVLYTVIFNAIVCNIQGFRQKHQYTQETGLSHLRATMMVPLGLGPQGMTTLAWGVVLVDLVPDPTELPGLSRCASGPRH